MDPFEHRSEGGELTDVGPFGPFAAESFRMIEEQADEMQHQMEERAKAAA